MKYVLLILIVISCGVRADNSSMNLNLPTTPQSYASDQFRAGDLDCRMAIGSSTNVEFGVVGVLNQNDPYQNNMMVNPNYNNDFVKDVGVYAKITIPIGAPKERLNCNVLYQLELQKKRLEVQKLQAEINNLKKLKFEN